MSAFSLPHNPNTQSAVSATSLRELENRDDFASKLDVNVDYHRRVVRNFQARQFKPKWFVGNNHIQTIIGSEALRVKVFGSYPRSFETKAEYIQTPDGDQFKVDLTTNFDNPDNDRVVILLHGLESNSEGPLVTKMTTSYLERGFSCVLVSFRSCDGVDNLTPGAYHLGFTDDVKQVCQEVRRRHPSKKIYLSGFSLGGNVVLKACGELQESAWSEWGIHGAVCCSVPFDPVASQGKIEKGFNRAVYSENFLQTLKKKAERKILKFPGAFDIEKIRACKTIGEFDDAFIAQIYGFADRVDYYRKTGSKWWLPHIRVPTIVINARDDPFIEESSLPTEEDVGPIAPVRLIYTDKGGHCGFMGATRCSFEEKVVEGEKEEEEVVGVAGGRDTIAKTASQTQRNWLADEMGRALLHLYKSSIKP